MNDFYRLPMLLALTLPAQGLIIRNYDAAVHDRFSSGFPDVPVMNPTFLHGASKFTGVGWWYIPGNPSASDIHFTLVSPRHVVSVRHLANNFGGGTSLVRFVASDNQVHTRTLSPFANIGIGPNLVDLALVTLSAPLPATVKPLRYCNNLNQTQLTGDPIMVLGKTNQIGITRSLGGSSIISLFDDIQYGPDYSTRMFRYNYATLVGGDDDCYVTPPPNTGDSSSPVFVDVGDEPALVGLNAASGGESPPLYQSFSTFVPHYIAELDAILNPQGYRMRPVSGVQPTTLALTTAITPVSQRQAYPGTVVFTLDNTGGTTTHNAAMTLTFAPGEAPASVTVAGGWISESLGGGVWSIRKATMTNSDNAVATASWTSLPAVPSLTVVVTRESEGFAATTTSPIFALAPSYVAWAAGLAEGGQGDDPDDDGLVNLQEYALGGNPESGVIQSANGGPLLPVLDHEAGVVAVSFPERADAVLRGLSYVVETSTTLDSPSWTTILPAGASTSTAAMVPAVPGFVNRTVTWPADGPVRFARLKVELAE